MTSLRAFFNAFMASSDYTPNSSERISLNMVREILYRSFSLILPLAVAASMIFSWYNVRRELAIIEACLLLFLIINAYRVFRSNSRLFSNEAFCLVVIFFLSAPIATGFTEFLYFCLLYPILFYVLVSRKSALFFNACWLALCAVLATSYLTSAESVCYVVSHIAIWVLIEIFFSLLAYNEKELLQLSVRDPLTGAYNRRAMKSFLENAVQLCERYSTASSIVMLDIDHFKEINDNYGHKEGDLVLKQLTAILDNRLRRTDKLCRYGGEEFVLVLPNTDADHAFQLADIIRDQVRNSILTSKRRITVSCGVAEVDGSDSIQDWLHRGDLALYRAKQGGRDRVVLYDDATPSLVTPHSADT